LARISSASLLLSAGALGPALGTGYGRAGGAIINATIRSGTNQFHSVVYDYLRNTVLDAYGPFIGTGLKPTLIQNQFGGTMGGSIKRDGLFFFGDFEGLRHLDCSIQTAVVPTAAQAQVILEDIARLYPRSVLRGWYGVEIVQAMAHVDAGPGQSVTGVGDLTVFPLVL
jgi:hypothetical protein